MKRFFLLIVLISFVLLLPAIIDLEDNLSAQRGCCMERKSLSSNSWHRNSLSFRKCRDENRRRDGDNLYERRGYIYWNGNC
jgi:hypothetical protein